MAQAALILGTTAYGAYAQDQAGEAQQDLANRNAKMLKQSADDEIERGNEEVLQIRRRGRAIKGAQRAAFAAQGVDVDTGTALDLQNETDAYAEQDAATARRNAARAAWGLRVSAANQRLGGRYAARAGTNAAIGTAFDGVSRAYPYFRSSAPTVK